MVPKSKKKRIFSESAKKKEVTQLPPPKTSRPGFSTTKPKKKK